MHAALAIDELLRIIVDFLAAGNDKRSVAYFARTCKSVYPIASAVLWQSLPDLVPLIRCLPVGAWLIDDKDQILRLTRTLHLSDWDLFIRCAARVHSLGVDEYDPGSEVAGMQASYVTLDVSVLEALAIQQRRSPLFPNLRTVHDFALIPADKTVYFTMLLGPKLRDLSAFSLSRVRPEYMQVVSLLSHIQATCPGLTTLTLDLELYMHCARDFIGLIRSLPLLEEFSCSGAALCMRAFSALGSLKNLRAIDISVERIKSDYLAFTTPTPFEALCHFTISVEGLACIVSLLECMTLQVESFVLTIEEVSPSKRDIRCFFEAVGAYLPRTLKLFRLESIRRWSHERLDVAEIHAHIDPAIVRLLFVFPNLLSVSLNPTWWFTLNDALLEDIASTWPNLQSLHLGTRGFATEQEHVPRGISLYGLLALVRCCPKLSDLALIMHAEVAPGTALRRPGRECVNTLLTEMAVGGSTIVDPLSVALFLSDVFPNLREISSWQYVPPENDDEVDGIELTFVERWSDVQRAIPYFVLARQQGREDITGRC